MLIIITIFSEDNHDRVLVLRYLEHWVCELLTNRHHRSSVCD